MCSKMCLSGVNYLKEKKHCSVSASLWVVLPALFSKTFLSLRKWRNQWKGMRQRIDMNKNTKNGGALSVQPSSFVVFSSRSSSLSTSLWSLLAMVFLLLSSLVPFFFSCIGNGFTDYKERKQDESHKKKLCCFSNVPVFLESDCSTKNSQHTFIFISFLLSLSLV